MPTPQGAFSSRTKGHSPIDAAGRDRIDEASAESFPASDPPAWAAGCEKAQDAAPTDARAIRLRAAVGDVLTIEYCGGPAIRGHVLAVRPARGTVDFVVLSEASLIDAEGDTIETAERLVVCVADVSRFVI
jgi:hypothetical protein